VVWLEGGGINQYQIGEALLLPHTTNFGKRKEIRDVKSCSIGYSLNGEEN
jgi:hypothetical protein